MVDVLVIIHYCNFSFAKFPEADPPQKLHESKRGNGKGGDCVTYYSNNVDRDEKSLAKTLSFESFEDAGEKNRLSCETLLPLAAPPAT